MLKSINTVIYTFAGFHGCVLKTFCNFKAARKYYELAEEYYFRKKGYDAKYGIGIGIVEYPALFRTKSDKRYPKTIYLVSSGDSASSGGCVEMAFDKIADAEAFARLLDTETSEALEDSKEFEKLLDVETFVEAFHCLSESDVEELFANQDELDLILGMFDFEES